MFQANQLMTELFEELDKEQPNIPRMKELREQAKPLAENLRAHFMDMLMTTGTSSLKKR